MKCCKRKDQNSFRQTSIKDQSNSLTDLKKTIESQFKLDVIDDPHIIFLSSSLNNILVCSILKGINLTLNEFQNKDLNI